MSAEIAAIGGASKINFTAIGVISTAVLVSSGYGLYIIVPGATSVGTLVKTHQDYYVTSTNVLYTGTVTTGETQYINTETGLI